MTQLKKEAKDIGAVYIATDPDREGEAIGWHIRDRVFKGKEVYRVDFHEITATAVKAAFTHPRDFNDSMVEAQISRRILDRIVGYYLSPLLWKKVARGLSAGRVQSVALRLIIEREKLIRAFTAQEYWVIEAELRKKGQPLSFIAKLDKIKGEKVELKTGAEAQAAVDGLSGKPFVVSELKKVEKNRNPDAPFITSTLQQEAFNKLRYNSSKTMLIAQQLYEGIDIGEESPSGLITYMRTDSVRTAPEAINQAREYIKKEYGDEYLPEKPPVYKTKKFAQEAHEAIRPTHIGRRPAELKQFLTEEQYELYELVFNRFLASQMNPARFLQTTAVINAGDCIFNASGSLQLFDGFSRIYKKEDEDKEKNVIPGLDKGEELDLLKLSPSQHFTKPPARFSDSSLVKILEEEGIGRPSTYAPIISTLIQRGYVSRIRGYLNPTELGFKVCDLLVEFFPEIMDVKFTAAMEGELDEIEEGKIARLKVLNDFYAPFKVRYDFAQSNIKKEIIETNEICEKCGKPMVIKWGKKGKFLSCSDFPTCKQSRSITTGVKCPSPGCAGELIERRSRRGVFYGCSKFPVCRFISKDLPGSEAEKDGDGKEKEEQA
jgi:DNA topoisomerase-1